MRLAIGDQLVVQQTQTLTPVLSKEIHEYGCA